MNKYLKDIFIHLDGIAMAPIYEFLSNNNNILSKGIRNGVFRLEYRDGKNHNLNRAYCSVLSKILQAQNIIAQPSLIDNYGKYYSLTDYGKDIFNNNSNYSGFKDYYISSISLIEGKATLDSSNFVKNFKTAYLAYLNSIDKNGIESLISKHLEGSLIGPILIYCEYTDSNKNNEIYSLENDLQDFIIKNGMIENGGLTEKGKYLLSKSYAYGVTDSYMKTFIHLETLCTDSQSNGISNKIDKNKNEYHVDRSLNVWGSGNSHTTYFKHIDKYVIDIFNKPLEKQPKGIADMGCGDGAFLYHLNELIKSKTLRGKYLDSHPLLLIGADFNQAALDSTQAMFSNNNNKPITVLADISKPDIYAKEIFSNHSLNISDFLNVRSFLDHNRRFDSAVKSSDSNKYAFKNITTNCFSWKGDLIKAQDTQIDLVEHFKKWKKYISKYGLLVLELHSIDIDDIYPSIGKIPMTAYLATHGFSDQFIIEYEVYKECLLLAGLNIDARYEKIFPNQETKMISINLIS